MTCLDCLDEGKNVTCTYDHKQLGNVCPRCERVYSPMNPRGNLHYATKKGVMARIQKDRHKQSLITRAMGDHIIQFARDQRN